MFSNYRNLYKVYPEGQVQTLMSCKEFRTLEDHAHHFVQEQKEKRFLRPQRNRSSISKLFRIFTSKLAEEGKKLPVSDREKEQVLHQLVRFREDGFLVSEKDIHNKVLEAISFNGQNNDAPAKISIFGVPTKNRPELLVRCVKSFLENPGSTERGIKLHIVDDSDTPARTSRQTISDMCKNHHMHLAWVDKKYRADFARKIARAANVPIKIVEFALMGNKDYAFRTGASRNTLLLLAAGNPSVQTDDDIICRIVPAPWKKEGITLMSLRADCHRYQYYTDAEKFHQTLTNDHRDFFSLHENLLGSHPAAVLIMNDRINTEHLGGTLLEKIGHSASRLAVTFTGIYGDSGMSNHWQRVCLEGESFSKLVNHDELVYKQLLCTRYLFRSADNITIGDSQFCMAGVMGLDTRHLLPPFMPVLRNEDAIFGLLVHLCFKHAVKGYLPWALLHDPPFRSPVEDPSRALNIGFPGANAIVEAILWSLNVWPLNDNPSHNLKTLGQYLTDLSCLPIHHFKSEVRKIYQRIIQNRINYLQHFLFEHAQAPEHWQHDMKQLIKNFQLLLYNEDVGVPADIEGDSQKRLATFQELIKEFGNLLQYWPAIWGAAVDIQKNYEFDHLYS